MVLGIQREKGNFIGTPAGSTKILPKDVLTVYGKASSFDSLDTWKKGTKGDKEHKEAVVEHLEAEQTEKSKDELNN